MASKSAQITVGIVPFVNHLRHFVCTIAFLEHVLNLPIPPILLCEDELGERDGRLGTRGKCRSVDVRMRAFYEKRVIRGDLEGHA